MARLADFEQEAADLDRRLWFLWVATAVAAVSLLLSRGMGLLVWGGVLALCAGGLLLARHSYVRLARQIEHLPRRSRDQARRLLMRHGRFLFVRMEDARGGSRPRVSP
ncbi:MAG: hypothetical protein ACRDKA_05455 [Actinomycetota bacterium]